MDEGVLLLRLLLAAVLCAHAVQKLFGWLSGPGRAGAAGMFESLGHRPAVIIVPVAGALELTASLLLAVGLMTPLAAAIAAGVLLVAGVSLSVARSAFWASAGGGEYAIVLAVAAAALGAMGGGRFSLDQAMGIGDDMASIPAALPALLALVAAAPPILQARRNVRRARQRTEQETSAAAG